MSVRLLFGLLALFLSTAHADGGTSSDVPGFKDVRIGQSNGQSRVVVLCADWCDATKEVDGSFFLSGVGGALKKEFGSPESFITSINITPVEGGAFLFLKTRQEPGRVALTDCGAQAICVDMTHETRVSSLREPAPEKVDVLPVSARPKEAEPRETAPEIAPPESTDKPVTPVRTATLREEPRAAPAQTIASPVVAELTRDLLAISPAPLSPTTCLAAQGTLQADAWNLDAYRLVALCKAKDGDYATADRLLVRLLQFAPDDKIAAQARPMIAAAMAGEESTQLAGSSRQKLR
jgi:hypothetical protein